MLQLSGVPSRCSTLLKFKNLNSTPKPKMKWNSKARKTQPAAQVLATRRSQVQAALGSCDGVVWRHRVRYEQTMSNTTVARRCHATRGENAQAVKPPFGSIWQVATSSLGMSILKLKCNHEQSITLIRHQVHQVLLALPRTAPLQFARIWTLHRDSALLKLRFLPEQRVLEVFLHLNVHSRSSSK